ncbi:uncharacterized protein LOC124350079 isoform X1 [Daphnia pulicaria]|uniref:uncharacterized protein LOC124350079 isoform X1 n=1 Tax=Daphnia pulicaria TaxID=35523 RepID=UPI001EECCA0C|nr:uncharacterized protein LOC124350079 isoform X1 [Daphnia pulicaria]
MIFFGLFPILRRHHFAGEITEEFDRVLPQMKHRMIFFDIYRWLQVFRRTSSSSLTPTDDQCRESGGFHQTRLNQRLQFLLDIFITFRSRQPDVSKLFLVFPFSCVLVYIHVKVSVFTRTSFRFSYLTLRLSSYVRLPHPFKCWYHVGHPFYNQNDDQQHFEKSFIRHHIQNN